MTTAKGTGAPKGARLFPLQHDRKIPLKGTRGHLEAVPADDFAHVDNYGISLDGQWVLLDIDKPNDPSTLELLSRLDSSQTWSQNTPRGKHFLFRAPAGFEGTNSKFPGGDIKVKGYLVGPGSKVDGKEYVVVDAVEPLEAPEWLLEKVRKGRTQEVYVDGQPIQDRDKIAIGENDVELFSLACNMRRRGFTKDAILSMLMGIVNSGVVEMVPGSEYSLHDLDRLARQAARYEPEYDISHLHDEAWVCATDINLVGPPIRWWVRGFVPRAELVMLYGKGAVGKSSFASWLASEVTRKGGKFLFVGVEEPFTRFAARAIIGEGKRELLFTMPNATSFQLPRDAEKLRDQIVLAQANVVYFDSIYSHFPSGGGDNAAERARRCLGPLAEIAQDTGCTIVATFHENKMGQYLGSTEMLNVPRYVLKATRGVGPLRISVDKTNLFDPGYVMQLDARDEVFMDPATGIEQLEENDEGKLVPMTIKVLSRVSNGSVEDFIGDELNLDNVDDSQALLEAKVVQAIADYPHLGPQRLYEKVGGSKQKTLRLISQIKGTT